MRSRLTLSCAAAALVSAAAAAAVPNLFVAGQPASAAQVNQNLAYLDLRAGGAIGTLVTSGASAASDLTTSVASVACNPGSIVLGASCSCLNASGTRNLGVLFGCSVAGNGGVVGCFPEPATYNPNLPPPEAQITVVCLGGFQVDGTPLFAFPAAKVTQDGEALAAREAELREVEADRAGIGAEER